LTAGPRSGWPRLRPRRANSRFAAGRRGRCSVAAPTWSRARPASRWPAPSAHTSVRRGP
jgi:hypothetical protein